MKKPKQVSIDVKINSCRDAVLGDTAGIQVVKMFMQSNWKIRFRSRNHFVATKIDNSE